MYIYIYTENYKYMNETCAMASRKILAQSRRSEVHIEMWESLFAKRAQAGARGQKMTTCFLPQSHQWIEQVLCQA